VRIGENNSDIVTFFWGFFLAGLAILNFGNNNCFQNNRQYRSLPTANNFISERNNNFVSASRFGGK
jgi:hypothetical protein